MNLPALRKLDSMLIVCDPFYFYQKLSLFFLLYLMNVFYSKNVQETLDSMVNAEFWYTEVGLRAERKNKITRESKRWWLIPSPKVPKQGPSSSARKKLLEKDNVVYQIFKAAKSINQNVLLEMPVPTIIKDALPKVSLAFLKSYILHIP